jgi:exodeoxyribonuclease VII large subunit
MPLPNPRESPPLLTPLGSTPVAAGRIWQVGALCRAIADALESRFNPVAVRGEVSGFSRASSGHCYFCLKDAQGQIRCAMFKRAAGLLGFVPRDGDLVEVQGRLGVYEPRGELQLIVESLSRAGQGALFEQFLQVKARLEAEGLFDVARKRPVPLRPSGIGLVTSLGAAALHDVVTALRRRAPHVPVILAPSAVQGAQAPAELVQALRALYALGESGRIDVILLVRGGGSLEDLWAFNDEQLARLVVQSPVPLICGVGHETDFSIADFCADLRAPTPTAAAEMAAVPQAAWLGALELTQSRMRTALERRMDAASQRLDQSAGRIGRPLARLGQQRLRVGHGGQRLHHAVLTQLHQGRVQLEAAASLHAGAVRRRLTESHQRLDQAQLRLELMDPRLVLRRGYALLRELDGSAVTSATQTHPGQPLRALLADGEVDLTVAPARLL